MNKYNLTFQSHKAKFIVTYKLFKFYRLEHKSGFIDSDLWLKIGKAIPLHESKVKEVAVKLKGLVTFDKRFEKQILH